MQAFNELQSRDLSRLVEEQLDRLGTLDSWGEGYSNPIREFVVSPRLAPLKRAHSDCIEPCCNAWVVIEEGASKNPNRVVAFRPASNEWILAEEGEAGSFVTLFETSDFADALAQI